MAVTSEFGTAGLARYYAAKERADRYNRHLLQYGGALATVLGIGGASGSIFALADSIAAKGEGGSLPNLARMAIAGELAILGVAAVVLLFMLVIAYKNRSQAEDRIDEEIYLLGPDWVEKLALGRE